MNIKNVSASIVWKLILVCVASYGLLDGSGILHGAYDANFPHMFTNVSNLFACGYFLIAAIWIIKYRNDDNVRALAPQIKYTATVSLLVTMIIAHFLLFDAMFQDGQLVWHLVAMHYAVPVMALLDWLLFDEKGRMPAWGPLAWMSLVAVYLAVVMIGVGVFGLNMGGGTTADISSYPYTFLDPGISGAGGVCAFCAVTLAAFVVLGYALFGIDKLLGKARK